MSITKTVVGRPTTLAILFALLVGLGIYAASDLAIDLYPEITPPVLLVFTDYSGAGPEEVEKTITRPLEGALSNVSNVDEINSVSREGGSQVTLQFTWGTDMSEASNEVRDKLEFVKPYLPDDASSPQIFKFDPSMIPILNLVVKGNRSPEELRELAENIIQPRLEQVEGVAMVSVMGGRDRVIRVEVPQNRLAAFDLTLTQIANMLRGQNVQISAGSITEGNTNYLVRTSGEYQDIEQIRNTVIAYKGARPDSAPTQSSPGTAQSSLGTVRLRDVANVYDGFRKEETTVFINGQPGVYISIQKQSGSNSVQAADNVMDRLTEINRQLPIGTRMEVVFDTTTIIRNSLAQVQESALMGAMLAVVILFLFLRSFKSTLIIGLSIPISVIVTLMFMYFFDLTLNIMTLTGLVLGIGMLVDNSIVILENIYRYREKGAKLRISAIIGSQEMVNAIVASTLTTICVFAPIALFRSQLGMMGELFASLSFTVVISLTSSLLVAILLVPVLASRYLPLDSRVQRPLTGLPKKIDGSMERFFRGLDDAYRGALRVVLRFRKSTIIAVVGVFVASLFLIPVAGFEFMPSMEDDYVQVSVELPVGTKLEVTKSLMNQLEQLIRSEIEGYKEIIVSAGERSFFGFLGASQSHKGELTVVLPDFAERIDSSTDIKQKLRGHFNDFPSATFAFAQNGGPGGNASPIDVLVKTDDLDLGKETAVRIRDLIEEKIPSVTEPTVSLSEGLPQAEIVIDRDKAYALGLNIATIGQEVRANIDGTTASRFREGGNEYDILVILAPEDRSSLMDLDRVFVTNSMGQRIPLASFASWEYGTGPVSIARENQTRTLHVTGGLAPGCQAERGRAGGAHHDRRRASRGRAGGDRLLRRLRRPAGIRVQVHHHHDHLDLPGIRGHGEPVRVVPRPAHHHLHRPGNPDRRHPDLRGDRGAVQPLHGRRHGHAGGNRGEQRHRARGLHESAPPARHVHPGSLRRGGRKPAPADPDDDADHHPRPDPHGVLPG